MDDSPGAGDVQPGEVTAWPRLADPRRPLPDLMAIRLTDVPRSWPPYDDEVMGRRPAEPVYSSPAVMLSAGDPEGVPGPAPEVAADGGTGLGAGQAGEAGGPGSRRAGGGGPGSSQAGKARGGDSDRWPSQFAQVLAETLAGSRPTSQITPWTTERARAHIRRLGPLLAAEQRPRVHRILTSRPEENVVEVAVIVGFGSRTRALAARLERAAPEPGTPGRPARQARWLCTDVESA